MLMQRLVEAQPKENNAEHSSQRKTYSQLQRERERGMVAIGGVKEAGGDNCYAQDSS